jgi:chromatin remodeling complex protein RSC6
MPRKSSTTSTESKVSVPESKTTVSESKSSVPESKSSRKEKKPTSSLSTVPETTVQSRTEPTSTQSEKKPRVSPTYESVEKEFSDLILSVESEIEKLRDSSGKSKGVKFLRTVNKNLKNLKNHTLRIAKKKRVIKRDNTNSGFRKPVQISPELAKFTNWDPSKTYSRVQVTKYLCDYVRDNNLQNPADKRCILVEKDANLKRLLEHDGKERLTYPGLQTYLKKHFVKLEKVADAVVSKPEVKSASVQQKGKKVTV